MNNPRLLSAVIVRAAIIAIPRIVRIIIRRVVSIVARFRRPLRIDIVRVSASANQNREQPRAKQPKKCCCEIEPFFKNSFHKRLLGRSFDAKLHPNASKKIERIGAAATMRTAPMRRPTAHRKLVPVAVNDAAVVARTVSVVVANAGAHDCPIIRRPVIVRVWITVIVVRVRPIIACRIITGVVCCYVRPLCTSTQKSCDQACAKDRPGKATFAARRAGLGHCSVRCLSAVEKPSTAP